MNISANDAYQSAKTGRYPFKRDDGDDRPPYACETGIMYVDKDKSWCPSYGSSDCPLTVPGAVCTLSREELVRYIGFSR